jgi:EAL domain-containing protein (putative c-di-GMP-specific phosphodiesterase class I)
MISPGRFIPEAERTGLIVQVGEFVLKTVAEQVVEWQRQAVPVVRVAVNVSPVQLARQPIQDLVRRVLRETGMQPHQLALELTESAVLSDPDTQCQQLRALREDGVEIELDDFGTGYSSLAYVRQLPIDALKIDRSLVAHIDSDSSDRAIVLAILSLAQTLGLRVIAEGVERPGQLQVLGRAGCELAQGYYFSHPLPASDCRHLLLEVAERHSLSDTLRMRIPALRERP